jgi:hypothetical protein
VDHIAQETLLRIDEGNARQHTPTNGGFLIRNCTHPVKLIGNMVAAGDVV